MFKICDKCREDRGCFQTVMKYSVELRSKESLQYILVELVYPMVYCCVEISYTPFNFKNFLSFFEGLVRPLKTEFTFNLSTGKGHSHSDLCCGGRSLELHYHLSWLTPRSSPCLVVVEEVKESERAIIDYFQPHLLCCRVFTLSH